MLRDFATRPGFPNVSEVHIDAPHLLLNSTMIAELAVNKPWIRKLDVCAWAYCDVGGPVWGFPELRDVSVKFSGTRSFPCSFDQFHRQLPRRLCRLKITDAGPYYGRVDCAMLPVATEYTYLTNVTIDNRVMRWGRKLYTEDCLNGSLLSFKEGWWPDKDL